MSFDKMSSYCGRVGIMWEPHSMHWIKRLRHGFHFIKVSALFLLSLNLTLSFTFLIFTPLFHIIVDIIALTIPYYYLLSLVLSCMSIPANVQ